MLFHTFEFFVLLFFTFLAFYSFPKYRLHILAAANIIFYGVSGIGYLFLFINVALITYLCSLKLNKNKIYYYIGIAINILNLVFFKYTGFIINNIERFLHLSFPWKNSLLSMIILPVGISFYTFQLIAYLVDVKNKKIPPSKSFLNFWVFISFFGQLIAGPIMRGKEFMPQIYNIKTINYKHENIRNGIYYIAMGLIKKLVFADFLAGKADYYFGNAANLTSLDAWFAAYLFAFQIYFDFSAYSEIAVGVGHLFGLKLNLNFKSPYISSNPSEFWKRWHITLSTWIRDYIYIPLGGAKKGFKHQIIFLMIAMIISGFWHGAGWTFIVWGIYHGMLLIIHKVYKKWIKKHNPSFINNKFYKPLCVFIFFQFSTIGWVLFRANSLSSAISIIYKMISFSSVIHSKAYILYFGFIAALYAVHIFEYYFRKNKNKFGTIWAQHFPPFIRAAGYTALFIIIILFTKTQQNSFIYFQF